MIEIHKTDPHPSYKDFKTRKKDKSTPSFPGASGINALESPFLEELRKTDQREESGRDKALDEILRQLDEQGRKFKDRPTMDELIKYKTLVRQFLDRTVKQAVRIDEHKGVRKGLKQTVYKKIEVIDQKLSELTMCILEKESRNINLMAKLDEIRGLLLDLRM